MKKSRIFIKAGLVLLVLLQILYLSACDWIEISVSEPEGSPVGTQETKLEEDRENQQESGNAPATPKDFPNDILVGTWSDVETNLFVGVKDIVSGAVELSSSAFSYMFNSDSTYEIRAISTGGILGNRFVIEKGKYRINGNTITLYDTTETLYKGRPMQLEFEDRAREKPSTMDINRYDPSENKIDFDGIRLKKLE